MTTATLDDLIALNDEIGALVRAGVPLEQGLAELGDDMPGRLGRVAAAVAERTARGESLQQALADHALALPPRIAPSSRPVSGQAGCPPRSRPSPRPLAASPKPNAPPSSPSAIR